MKRKLRSLKVLALSVILLVAGVTFYGVGAGITVYAVGKYPTKPLDVPNTFVRIAESPIVKGNKAICPDFYVDTKTDIVYFVNTYTYKFDIEPYLDRDGKPMNYYKFLEMYDLKVK